MLYFQSVAKFNKGKVDITDPCYNKDVWCRMSCDIIPGTYIVKTYIDDDGRVSRLNIIHQDYNEPLWRNNIPFILCGSIGVDAGLAGIFEDKPDYNDDDWKEICNILPFDRQVSQICIPKDAFKCNGIVCSSGWGDGTYHVYKKLNGNNQIFNLEIRFI